MTDSLYFSILSAVQTVVSGLGLTFNGDAVPVVVKKIPKVEEQLDKPPVIMVTPAIEEKTWKQSTFEGGLQQTYPVSVAILGSGNQDYFSNIDTYTSWYEAIESAFLTNNLPGVTQVWDCEVKPADIFNRRVLSTNFDFLALIIRFKVLR